MLLRAVDSTLLRLRNSWTWSGVPPSLMLVRAPTLLSLVLLGSLLPSTLLARTWSVYVNRSGDAPTIQAGIDSSASGDTVLVHGGVFQERLTLGNKSIVLKGQGPALTKISGQGLPVDGSPLLSLSNVDSTMRVTGFSFEDNDAGLSDGLGGAITCWQSCSAIITSNYFLRNRARDGGAIAITATTGTPVITQNTFIDNWAAVSGGAVSVFYGFETRIVGNTFRDNSASEGGAVAFAATLDSTSKIRIVENEFLRNEAAYGGAIRIFDGDVLILGNSLVENRSNATEQHRAAGVHAITITPVTIANNIVAYNQNGWGITSLDAPPTLTCNDFWGNALGDYHGTPPGVTDFSLAPQFCDRLAGDLTLATSSPCLPANSGGCGLIGANAEGCSTPLGVSTGGRDDRGQQLVVRMSGLDTLFHLTLSDQFGLLSEIDLTIFDVGGRRVHAVLLDRSGGTVRYLWNGKADSGRVVPRGVYFARLRVSGGSEFYKSFARLN